MAVILAGHFIHALDHFRIETAVDLAGQHRDQPGPPSRKPAGKEIGFEPVLLNHGLDSLAGLR